MGLARAPPLVMMCQARMLAARGACILLLGWSGLWGLPFPREGARGVPLSLGLSVSVGLCRSLSVRVALGGGGEWLSALCGGGVALSV